MIAPHDNALRLTARDLKVHRNQASEPQVENLPLRKGVRLVSDDGHRVDRARRPSHAPGAGRRGPGARRGLSPEPGPAPHTGVAVRTPFLLFAYAAGADKMKNRVRTPALHRGQGSGYGGAR